MSASGRDWTPDEGDEVDVVSRSDWTFSDYAVEAICRAVGCRSILGDRWRAAVGYPHVCNPLCLWLFDRDERKERAT